MWDFDDGWDFDDDTPSGKARCSRCGELWPAGHLDTDSGDCITCEDADEEE